VRVGVASGVAALLDLSTVSGRVRSDLGASGPPTETEARVELVLSTVSGNVEVARA
jgi:predicted membrane protein